MNLIEQLKWRYATKRFDPNRKLTHEQLHTILEAVNLSASSLGLQPYRIFVVEDSEVRKDLRLAARNQSQVTDASHIFVFAVKTNLSAADVAEFVRRVSQKRGIPLEELAEYQNRLISSVESRSIENRTAWAARQAYIALGFLLVTCAVENIDACPMEGFSPEEFDRILGLTEKGLTAVVMAAVGFRSSGDKYQYMAKVRHEISDLYSFV